jgi:hypothetical protein
VSLTVPLQLSNFEAEDEGFSTQPRYSSSILGVLSSALPGPYMKGTQWAMDRSTLNESSKNTRIIFKN